MKIHPVKQYVGPNRLYVEGWMPEAHSDRPPVLCIGGAFDGSWIYARFTRILAELGWPTYAMNLRGYYKSIWNDVASLSTADYLADIAAVREGLGLRSPIIVGYSIGGILAQKSAELLGAKALVLYDSDASREVAIQSGMRVGHSPNHIPPVCEFWPGQDIVEEMWGRKVSASEYKEQLALFKQSRLSGKACREIEVDRISVGRIQCPILILGIDRRNRAHEVMFHKRSSSWYSFEGYSHGSLLVSPEADRITRMVVSWLSTGYPVRRRRVFRTATIRDDKPSALLAKGGSFRGKENRRIAERSGSHLIVADEGIITHLKYFSGWSRPPSVRVVDGARHFDVPMKHIGEGRTKEEHLYEAFFELTQKRGFFLRGAGARGRDLPASRFEDDDEDRAARGTLYKPELKDVWLADGEFFGYRPPDQTIPPRFIDMQMHSKALEHDFVICVRLPRNYNPSYTYPVAILNDGQNQWTNMGFHGGWHTDSVTDELIHRGRMREIILVAVECHRFRNRAYLPPPTARAHLYVDFLADHVLPELRKTYSISTNPSEIAIIGASFGANNAVYAGLKRPDVFGLVGALSFAYIHGNPQIKHIDSLKFRPFRKIYIDCGTKWDDDQEHRDDYTVITRKLIGACSKKWMTHGKDLMGLVAKGHYHSEYFWRQRIGGCLKFLFRQE